MTRIRLSSAIGAILLAAVLAIAGLLPLPLMGPPPAQAATTLKAQFFLPKGHPVSKRLEQIYGEIASATGAEVKIQGYYASELVPLPQALDGLSKGTLDLLVGPGAYYSGKIALADFGIMPLNFKRYADRSKAFYDEGVGEMLDQAFGKFGVTVVAPYNYYIGEDILLRKGVKVQRYEDLKGLKIRVAGGELIELVKAMGAQPVFIAPPEMYTAFQRGTVDGAIFPHHDLVPLKLHEVVDTVLGPDFLFSGPMMHFFKFNKGSWSRLSERQREQVRAVLKQAALRDDEHAKAELDDRFKAMAEKQGVKFTRLSDADVRKASAATDKARAAFLQYNREQGNGEAAERILKILDRLSGL
jgi:TRAP-type C4-dicarboxylate transport system substrate-binding protein